jgi:transposase
VNKPDPSPPMKAAAGGKARPPRGLGIDPKEESDVLYCGMDVHSRLTAFHLMDAAGQLTSSGTFATTEEDIGIFCRSLPKLTQMFVEASTASAWFARYVEGCGHRVMVVDPNRIRAISNSPKKTDAHDAMTLATLGRAGLLTRVHVRSEETDKARRLLTMRHGLVRARSSLIVMARSLFRSAGHLLPGADGDDFGERLTSLWEIPEGFEELATPLGTATKQLTEQILAIEEKLDTLAPDDQAAVRRLMGIPGVGKLIATSFMALMESPARFSCSSQVAAYLGLAPWVNESAGKRKEGGITKRGHKVTRALLVQAAWAHMRSGMDTALKQWFHKLERRVGRKKAITGLARKIGELMWALWRKEGAYQPFPSSSRRSVTAP